MAVGGRGRDANTVRRARTALLAAVLAAASMVGTAGTAVAAPGDLDANFGTNGTGGTVSGPDGYGSAMARQSDGKLVVGGNLSAAAIAPNFDMRVARYNTNGTLDTTFGLNGSATTDRTTVDRLEGLAIQSDGKVVAVGSMGAPGLPDFAVVRYQSNGNLDLGFGVGGVVTTNIRSADEAEAVAIQADGKIVVAGRTSDSSTRGFAVARYNTNGTLDTTFSGDGLATTDLGGGDGEGAYDVAVLGDGKIVTSGCSGFHPLHPANCGDFALVRYESDGDLDLTFGGGDGSVVGPSGAKERGSAVLAVQADGKLVVGGARNPTGPRTMTLARYSPDGVLDSTFDGDGVASGPAGRANDIALQADGKIVVAGQPNSTNDFLVARFDSNGSLDTTFSGDGWTTTDFDPGDDAANSVLVVPAGAPVAGGKIVAAGGGAAKFALARYEVTGGGEVADVSIGVTDGPDPVASGGEVTYTATVSNAGPQVAYQVQVTATLPAGAALVTASASQGLCGDTPGTVTCVLNGLPPSSSAQVTLVVNPGPPGTAQLTAGVATSSSDPNPANNTAIAATLVNPGAGAWASRPALGAARSESAAVDLGDGRVLVSGGVTGSPATVTAGAEVYDPATGAWTATSSMATARSNHTSTVLADGRVLVAGGINAVGDRIASAEIWNPATGAWAPAGTMAAGHSLHKAVLLNTGRVLVVGGVAVLGGVCPGPTGVPNSAELYNPATNSWTATDNLEFSRVYHTTTRLNDGRVLAVGGYVGTDFVAACGGAEQQNAPVELYDPGSATWSRPSNLALPRHHHAATLLDNGTVLVTGGNSCNGDCPTTSVERFDPGTGQWTPASSLPRGRSEHTATRSGAKVLLAGGKAAPGPTGVAPYVFASLLYDRVANTWTPAGMMGIGRVAPMVPQSNGRVLGAGGVGSGGMLSSVEQWTPRPVITGVSPATAAHGATVTLTGTGLATVGSVSLGGVPTTNVTHDAGSPDTILRVVVPPDAPNAQVALVATSPGGPSEPAATLLTVLGGTFTPLPPARILDTRFASGTCAPSPCGPVGPGQILTLQVTGAGGVPAGGVAAVVMNMTVTQPTSGGYLTVWPSDGPQPNASNLNFAPGQTVPNLVTVRVGADGAVKVFNAAGTTQVIADVAGWYDDGTAAPAARYSPLPPVRILDTRSAAESGGATPIGTCVPSPCGPIGPGQSLTLTVAGTAGVPATGASAVTMNLTVTGPSADSYLTVWPSGEAQPNASNLNYTAGQTVPNLVTVKLGSDGKVQIFNASGTTHVIADVAGWFGAAGSTSGARLTPLTPQRILDTRSAAESGGATPIGTCVPSPCTAVGPAQVLTLTVAGAGGVPTTGATAVVMNVTVTAPTSGGYLTVWPSNEAQPNASNLNFGPGQSVPNLVTVKLGADGKVKIFNSAGTTHVIADVAGWTNDGT